MDIRCLALGISKYKIRIFKNAECGMRNAENMKPCTELVLNEVAQGASIDKLKSDYGAAAWTQARRFYN